MDHSTGKSFHVAKICRPRGNRPMLRPRLFRRLDEIRGLPVTWLCAPPGSGKTTLVSSYLAERGLDGPWVQLDADDADIATFFYYLGVALEQAAVRDGPALPALRPEYVADKALMSFTRRCAQIIASRLGAPAVIVLDNYEQVPAQASLHEVVRELASSLPQGLNLFVLSRTDPPPSCARLRLHENLVLLDAQELGLTRDEALALVAARESRPLSATDRTRTDRLLVETQGWFAGFTLLLAESGRPDPPAARAQTHQLLFDYFASELFGHIEPSMQDALLRTALLPTMTAADARRISGHAAVGGLLADLHRRNCFVVQRGAAEPVYEYHALFRAFLANRGAALLSADDWRALQSQSAELLAQTGRVDAAAGLYRAAQDWTALSALVLRAAPGLIAAGRHRTLENWLAGCRTNSSGARPGSTTGGPSHCLPFDAVAARGIFEQAYEGFQREDDAVGLYCAWTGAMESFFFEWRDFRPADRWIAEFERLRARHPRFPSRAVELRTYWAMGTLLHRQPQHPALPAWAERAQALLDPADRDLSVQLGGYLVIWFLWRGETLEARSVIDRIAPWTGPDMSPMVLILWSCARRSSTRCAASRAQCRAAVGSGLDLARQTGLHAFDFLLWRRWRAARSSPATPRRPTPGCAMAGAMRATATSTVRSTGTCSATPAPSAALAARARTSRGALAMALDTRHSLSRGPLSLDLARALRARRRRRVGRAHAAAARDRRSDEQPRHRDAVPGGRGPRGLRTRRRRGRTRPARPRPGVGPRDGRHDLEHGGAAGPCAALRARAGRRPGGRPRARADPPPPPGAARDGDGGRRTGRIRSASTRWAASRSCATTRPCVRRARPSAGRWSCSSACAPSGARRCIRTG